MFVVCTPVVITAMFPSVAACATAEVAWAICCCVGPGGAGWTHPDVHVALTEYVAVLGGRPGIVNVPDPFAGLVVLVAFGNGASSGPLPLALTVPPHVGPEAVKVRTLVSVPATATFPPRGQPGCGAMLTGS